MDNLFKLTFKRRDSASFRRLLGVTGLALLIGLSSVELALASKLSATAKMQSPDAEAMGTVTLTQTAQGVLLSVNMRGLSAGAHGFHIHETGSCSPDFKAAGGHYNPHGGSHGFSHDGEPHAGDMPNIYAHADGTVRADALNSRVSLKENVAGTLFDENGSAIIIHEKPDSYGENAGAGGRVACGVIQLD